MGSDGTDRRLWIGRTERGVQGLLDAMAEVTEKHGAESEKAQAKADEVEGASNTRKPF